MFYSGMVPQGLEYVENLRSRYDGVKRNPWDEAECGHHYARAMSSWSSVVALSGFQYQGDRGHVIALPRVPSEDFRCFWATGTGWGTFGYAPSSSGGTRFTLEVLAGRLPHRSCEIAAEGTASSVRLRRQPVAHARERQNGRTVVRFAAAITLEEGDVLEIEVGA